MSSVVVVLEVVIVKMFCLGEYQVLWLTDVVM